MNFMQKILLTSSGPLSLSDDDEAGFFSFFLSVFGIVAIVLMTIKIQ